MQQLWKLVHSPRHLLVFEATARRGSFTAAARELNVSQPAVSLSIRQLERALGVALFTRAHRSVRLTTEGSKLYHDVSAGFSRILETARELNTAQRQHHVTISVSSAFGTYWMLPRLGRFHAAHPGIDLRLQSSEYEPDLRTEGISFGIRRGSGRWPGYHAALIARERLSPIASPAFLNAHPPLRQPADVAGARLIHLEEPVRPRPTWRDWFAEFGVRYEDDGSGLRLNDYALVLQAAMAGEGIAMGWRHVTEGLVAQELLTRFDNMTWQSPKGFYIVWAEDMKLSEQALNVRNWIVSTAEEERGRRRC